MELSNKVQSVDYGSFGFNPLQVIHDSPFAHLDNVGMIRDIFSAIFPDFGEIQLSKLREALKQSYDNKGWSSINREKDNLKIPDFQEFFNILESHPKPDKGLMARLKELNDYRFFQKVSGERSLLNTNEPTLIRVHQTQNEVLQRAFSIFILHNIYQEMFLRGTQQQMTHAIIFDEAHRASKLKLISTMAKECRKYGIILVLASQEARDFDPQLFNNIANYLVLRLTDKDAKLLAKIISISDQVNLYTDRIKQLPKYHAFFFGESIKRAIFTKLKPL